jgi:hypothetical protein
MARFSMIVSILGEQLLGADQVADIGEQHEHEKDHRQRRHDVGEGGPDLARALVIGQELSTIAHDLYRPSRALMAPS